MMTTRKLEVNSDICQFAVGFFSTCSMTSVSIGAFRESSLRPTFSRATKTALPGGSGAVPAGASASGADAPRAPLKGLRNAAATSAGMGLFIIPVNVEREVERHSVEALEAGGVDDWTVHEPC